MTERRLARLRAGRDHYALLAMDHGLTLGVNAGAPTVPVDDLVRACSSHISGVVVTYGVARQFRNSASVPLILQCFGAPAGHQRVLLGDIDSAVRLDAAAVSVQLDFGHRDFSDRARETSRLVHSAHSIEMPVLFMASGFDDRDGLATASVVRTCHELGADLIKISCARDLLDPARQQLRDSVKGAPPVLLAGGPVAPDIVDLVARARQTGFAGYCIGRSIFDAATPAVVAQNLDRVFATPPIKGSHP